MGDLPAEPEKAELTEEEKNTWFRPTNPPEMQNKHIERNFTKFSVPEKAEGFDEVVFDWQGLRPLVSHHARVVCFGVGCRRVGRIVCNRGRMVAWRAASGRRAETRLAVPVLVSRL